MYMSQDVSKVTTFVNIDVMLGSSLISGLFQGVNRDMQKLPS